MTEDKQNEFENLFKKADDVEFDLLFVIVQISQNKEAIEAFIREKAFRDSRKKL